MVVCAIITLAVIVAGIPICNAAANTLAVHDHPGIVWDEIAGMMLVMIFVPISLTTLALGFLLFRVFDILKPWPIRAVDRRVGGGLGIMLDDLIAAIFAGVILYVLMFLFQLF